MASPTRAKDPERIAKQFKRMAALYFVVSVVTLGGVSLAILQGTSMRGSHWIVAFLAAAGLVVSIRMLRGGSAEFFARVRQRQAKPAAVRAREDIQYGWRGLAVAVTALAAEIPVGMILWPLEDWQSGIVAVISVTLLAVLVLATRLIRSYRERRVVP